LSTSYYVTGIKLNNEKKPSKQKQNPQYNVNEIKKTVYNIIPPNSQFN